MELYGEGKHNTFNEILLSHARMQGEKTAYYLLDDKGNEVDSINYGLLLKNVQYQANKMRQKLHKGDHCLLIFQPGLELIIGLLSCFYAGVIAVPVNPPKRNKANTRFWGILNNSKSKAILLDKENQDLLDRHFNDIKNLEVLQKCLVEKSDDLPDQHNVDYGVKPEDIAFLQYTSGSTASPKGVMVSHQNLKHNSEVIRQSFNHDSNLVVINWLPPFHDMGLIGNLLQPLYVGGSSVIMHPNTFLRSPVNWLNAITKYKGTTTGCPNFALEYCADRATEEQKAEIDLSSLKVMFCGSERVRKRSLDRFADAFKETGFSYNKYLPCYGLAESTLMVSGIDAREMPISIKISKSKAEFESRVELTEEENDSMESVGCGYTWNNNKMAIVDPDTGKKLADDNIGEIWVSGRSVCKGYWNNAEASENTFRASLANESEKDWLRTGDLGFIHENQLFVTGRLKDTIIIRGANYFPDYIEEMVENSHDALQKGGCAVFSIEQDDDEKLIVMQEVKRTALRDLDEKEVFQSIREAVSVEFEIPVHEIKLIKPGRLPKTSSGKVQRHLCKKSYLNE